MAGTVIAAVRSALMEAVAALPEFTDVRVDMTWSPKPQDREQVFTTKATFTHTPAAMRSGRNHRDERGQFEVVVYVMGVDQTATWSANRAVALGTVIEEWLADRKSGEGIGVDGLNWIQVEGDGALTELYTDRATFGELTYTVNYQARLT